MQIIRRTRIVYILRRKVDFGYIFRFSCSIFPSKKNHENYRTLLLYETKLNYIMVKKYEISTHYSY